MAIKILPYKRGSASAKALADALGVKRLKLEGSRWKPRPNDVVINWGSRKQHPALNAGTVLNPPDKIELASNKIKSFERFKQCKVKTPEFSLNKEDAFKWIENGKKVVCRTVLGGHSGEGIVIAETEDEVVDAPLYTSYIPKKDEFRVHVMDSVPFFIQRKARLREVPDDQVNWQVRNLKGGFIYANQDIEAPIGVENVAVEAVLALGLDFGAVDVLVTNRGNVFVLEVNTACGLAGTTLDKYSEAFLKYLGKL